MSTEKSVLNPNFKKKEIDFSFMRVRVDHGYNFWKSILVNYYPCNDTSRKSFEEFLQIFDGEFLVIPKNVENIKIKTDAIYGYNVNNNENNRDDKFTGYNESGKLSLYEIIGYVFVTKDKSKRIQPIYVEEDYRGYGIGHILMNDAINLYGAKSLNLFTDNEIARHLYMKHGFCVSYICKANEIMTMKKRYEKECE